MSDLSVTYLGIPLKNPVIAGASGLTANMDTIKRIEDSGAGALVCKSLFEEEILLEALKLEKDLHKDDNRHAEMVTIFPEMKEMGPENHLEWVRKAKESVAIPVIGSLNAVHPETWLHYAKLLEQTGVDALELNLYADPDIQADSSNTIESAQIELLKKIRLEVKIPLSVKLSPYYTNTSGFISKLDDQGIDGFVLFNRFFQSTLDIEKEEIAFPFNFSHKEDSRLPLRYAGLLTGKVQGSICCNSGIMDSDDVIRMILAGADAVQVVSTLFMNGISHISQLVSGLEKWMTAKGYKTVQDFRGKMSRKQLGEQDKWIYRRTQYVRMLMQNSKSLMEKIL